MGQGLLRSFKQPVSQLKHWLSVARGAAEYRRTGVTPEAAYQSLIMLHCKSNGLAVDLMHAAIRSHATKCQFPHASGMLGELSTEDVARFAGQIRKQGYCVFPNRIPENLCAALEQFARTQPANVYPVPASTPVAAVYSSRNPQGDIYRFEEQTLLESLDMQRVLADYSLLSVAQEYLGCPPIIDLASMWWSVVNQNADQARKNTAAQLFHFDMDRVKWLKVFVYLTDVNSTGGPHCLIAGTHHAGAVPDVLLKRGYARIEDHEVAAHFPAEQIRELTGPRGTVLAVDTRALHKGKPPETHDRLIVQLSFCDNLFGGKYVRPTLPLVQAEELSEALERFPVLYQRYNSGAAHPLPVARAA